MSRFRVLLIAVIFLAGFSLRAQLRTRPGNAPYTPTKVEWAVLQLQASDGHSSLSAEEPVMIHFMDAGDGETVVCMLQYTPDVPAELVKLDRDNLREVFDLYAKTRGWPWLRLRFDERVLNVPPAQR
jgi:hypothetical protein